MDIIDSIKGNSVYKLMPIIKKQIVFTKKELTEESDVSVNTVSHIVDQLLDLGIIQMDKTVTKRGYRYQRIYEVFVTGNNSI